MLTGESNENRIFALISFFFLFCVFSQRTNETRLTTHTYLHLWNLTVTVTMQRTYLIERVDVNKEKKIIEKQKENIRDRDIKAIDSLPL